MQDQSNRKKWLMLGVKILIAAAVIWWVRGSIVAAWGQLWDEHDKVQWHWKPAWLLAAGVIYLLGLLPFGLFWHHLLRVLGQEARLGETLRAYYIGHLGKYVPGKAMVVILRAGLIRSHRVKTSLAAVSVFVETLTMMAVGAFLAAAYMIFYFRDKPLWCAAAGGLMVISLLPTVPPIFKRLARLAGVGKKDPDTAENLDKLSYGTLFVGWVASVIGWTVMAVSYWATLRGMGINDLNLLTHLACFTACVSLAVVAGFLLLVLPGGIGVREVFLQELILPHLEKLGIVDAAATALASAFLLRLVWLASELLISGILWVCLGKERETT